MDQLIKAFGDVVSGAASGFDRIHRRSTKKQIGQRADVGVLAITHEVQNREQELLRLRSSVLAQEMFGQVDRDPDLDHPVAPGARVFDRSQVVRLGEFVLPYEAVRKADDPEAALMAFLQSTYGAAAELADWDRASLETDVQRPGIPRLVGG